MANDKILAGESFFCFLSEYKFTKYKHQILKFILFDFFLFEQMTKTADKSLYRIFFKRRKSDHRHTISHRAEKQLHNRIFLCNLLPFLHRNA